MSEEKNHIEDHKAEGSRHKESSGSKGARDKAVEKMESKKEKDDELETKQDTSNQQLNIWKSTNTRIMLHTKRNGPNIFWSF